MLIKRTLCGLRNGHIIKKIFCGSKGAEFRSCVEVGSGRAGLPVPMVTAVDVKQH